MITDTLDVIQKCMVNGKRFKDLKFPGADFSGMSLRNADFRSCMLSHAKFVKCDLTYANFEGANLYGADFTDAILTRVNLKDANLCSSIMNCADMFGITITLECKSFQDMVTKPGWWAGFLFYALLMKPPSQDAKEKLIQAMGIEYWETLRSQYANRRW